MPTPNKGESKQDYLKRCTSELISEENRDSDQAYAMCNAFWDDAHNCRSMLNLTAPVEFAKSKKGESRKFMITGYTGDQIETWWGTLVFDLAGMQTKEKIPVLREHARDKVVGHGRAWNDENNFYVTGNFSKATEDAREVLELADEGYPWQASVGIWPKKILVLESKKESQTVNGKVITGPAEIWTESDVGEVSFVSLGRDDNTAAISFSEGEGKVPVNIERLGNDNNDNTQTKEQEMTLEELKKKYPELLAQVEEVASKEGEATGFSKGVADERQRVLEIMGAEADPIETKKAIETGIEADAAYKEFYKAEVKNRELGLKGMAAEATRAIGGEELSAEELAKKKGAGETPIDQKLTLKAKKLAEEKGITQAEAIIQLSRTETDLRRQWKPALGPAA